MAQVTTRGDVRWLVRRTRYASNPSDAVFSTDRVLQQFDGTDWVDVPIVQETERWVESGNDRREVPDPRG